MLTRVVESRLYLVVESRPPKYPLDLPYRPNAAALLGRCVMMFLGNIMVVSSRNLSNRFAEEPRVRAPELRRVSAEAGRPRRVWDVGRVARLREGTF